ncbi:hypothetical protein B0J11DRAFT_509668 [Dendryphion nanum]|uniref:Uncharacterized protein n=1 Tax=Dendryphion nanum TaxID=256645 RepID=A0A9P9IEN9_9PLEO|nr:hypothetical protein B0J11DRAFT_509668 [Dendryphion nanum]
MTTSSQVNALGQTSPTAATSMLSESAVSTKQTPPTSKRRFSQISAGALQEDSGDSDQGHLFTNISWPRRQNINIRLGTHFMDLSIPTTINIHGSSSRVLASYEFWTLTIRTELRKIAPDYLIFSRVLTEQELRWLADRVMVFAWPIVLQKLTRPLVSGCLKELQSYRGEVDIVVNTKQGFSSRATRALRRRPARSAMARVVTGSVVECTDVGEQGLTVGGASQEEEDGDSEENSGTENDGEEVSQS